LFTVGRTQYYCNDKRGIMFTGIIEALGQVADIKKVGSNIQFTLQSNIASQLRVDQSLSHNGVCLTVTEVRGDKYGVTAVDETLAKSNLGNLSIGDWVNLERSMAVGGRFDGHIVQGHVDQVGVCIDRQEADGSWIYEFEYDPMPGNITVEKGSVCVNGVSLTCFGSANGRFRVAIIPYTFEHTNFKYIVKDSKINLEFDILGKYIQRILKGYTN
jgi:riboflavin synthase